MQTVQAEKLFKQALSKAPRLICKSVTESGVAHVVQLIRREIEEDATDKQIEQWISESAADVAAHEEQQIEATLALCHGIDDARTRTRRSDLLHIGRNEIVLVRRQVPNIARTRNEHGERCWRIWARVGTRIEPYPRRDPRSAKAIAIENAKIEEQQAEPAPKPSELLAALP